MFSSATQPAVHCMQPVIMIAVPGREIWHYLGFTGFSSRCQRQRTASCAELISSSSAGVLGAAHLREGHMSVFLGWVVR